MPATPASDLRLIEHGFPCHQVGAQTRRERDGGNPPNMRLHVWWARRPLTPSRAAILASLAPANTDADVFTRNLGIEKLTVSIDGSEWTLPTDLHGLIEHDSSGRPVIQVSAKLLNRLTREHDLRKQCREVVDHLIAQDPSLRDDPVVRRLKDISRPLPADLPREGLYLPVIPIMADPSWFNELLNIAKQRKITVPNLYGYDNAYSRHPALPTAPALVLDPTAGGGSIPFEALRCGHSGRR